MIVKVSRYLLLHFHVMTPKCDQRIFVKMNKNNNVITVMPLPLHGLATGCTKIKLYTVGQSKSFSKSWRA